MGNVRRWSSSIEALDESTATLLRIKPPKSPSVPCVTLLDPPWRLPISIPTIRRSSFERPATFLGCTGPLLQVVRQPTALPRGPSALSSRARGLSLSRLAFLTSSGHTPADTGALVTTFRLEKEIAHGTRGITRGNSRVSDFRSDLLLISCQAPSGVAPRNLLQELSQGYSWGTSCCLVADGRGTCLSPLLRI